MNRLTSMFLIIGIVFILLLFASIWDTFHLYTFILSSCGLFAVSYMWLKMHQSLMKIGHAMSLSQSVTGKSLKELEPIVEHYHSLLDQTLVLKEELQEKKLNIVHSELNRSQTEINPHFLYNTLDSIYWMAKKEDMIDISEMVLNLSSFFRLSLHKGANTIALWNEIENLHYYLKIQQSRFMNRFTFHFDISDETKDLFILKKLIQPLVENCFIHGLERKPDKGIIWIRTLIQQDILHIEIEDNGMGIDEERLRYVQDRLGKINLKTIYNIQTSLENKDIFGMRNVKARLLLFYGSTAKLSIESKQNHGTKVVMRIPVSQVMDDS